MLPYSLTVEWYDNPPFEGGGTTVRIMSGDTILHHQTYRSVDAATKAISELTRYYSTRFVNSGGSDEDVAKWRSEVRANFGL